jgi:hypothetical protein
MDLLSERKALDVFLVTLITVVALAFTAEKGLNKGASRRETWPRQPVYEEQAYGQFFLSSKSGQAFSEPFFSNRKE